MVPSRLARRPLAWLSYTTKTVIPAVAETPVSEGAIKSYKGLKKLAMEEPGKLVDRDASIQATCLIGVRIAALFQLGEEGAAGMVGDSLPLCGGADHRLQPRRGHERRL